MKQYLLDTNICIFFLRKKYDVANRLRKVGLQNIHISEITVGELLYGAACSMQKEKHIKQISNLLNLFKVESIYPVLPVYAETKALLRRQGTMMDDFDLLIGATAKKYDMILVTENIRHLSHIPDVKIENWIDR